MEGDGLGELRTCAVVEVQAVISNSPVKLAAKRWEVAIQPERGGRVIALRLDGEELLDQGIGVDQPTAKGFVEAGARGWDEMVPNVDPTDTLPDHGEAWRLPWEVLSGDTMRCRGSVVPWELERRIELGDAVVVRYRYTNLGPKPHLAYWCAHPLFKLEAGMEISLQLPHVAEGKSVKVFLPKGGIDRARLRWASGRGIEMSWDSLLTPYVGVWVCNGDLGGYRHIAIEPATGGNDQPDPSAPPPLLAPGETFEWWVQIRAL
jgi:galactose mutarotase-like enzyme